MPTSRPRGDDELRPMLATAGRPPADPGWAVEFKWDGVRALVVVEDGDVRFVSRNGNDVTGGYPELVAAVPTDRDLVLDGEIVALDVGGRPDFGLLQHRMHVRTPPATLLDAVPVELYLFDVLRIDGEWLLHEPYDERRTRLEGLGAAEWRRVSVPPSFTDVPPAEVLEVARAHRLEGIVAKRRTSRYEPGRRAAAWVKTALFHGQEVVLGGWTPGRGNRGSTLGSLLLGAHDADGRLRYVGNVGTGFTEAALRALLDRMGPLRRAASPFDEPVPRDQARGVTWIEPILVGEVEYRTLTHDGRLRHSVWRGLRPDREPTEVVLPALSGGAAPAADLKTDPDADPDAGPGGVPPARTRERTPPAPPDDAAAGTVTSEELAALDLLRRRGTWEVGGRELALTNLDKVLFPGEREEPLTKRDVIRHYAVVAPYLVPYLRDRPVNLHRYPDGVDRPGFWQKEVPSHAPEWLRRWRNPEAEPGETQVYAVVDAAAALVWMANYGALELHPWTSALPDVHRPTWALIDIDPGTNSTFADVLVLARLYRTALDHLGVRAAPKVTGKRGVQIWVPVSDGYTFADTRRWVERLSRAVGRMVPELVTWEWYTDRRSGLIRLDYTQNAINKTLVAPFSIRPAPDAPVSVPLEWHELDDPDLRPDRWTVRTLPDRLAAHGDPLRPLIGVEQTLPPL
ncbi:DNA ligase D [Pseudonocardia kujensis]|uniref:DNA ligase D n=1 Tax=Pseudonocardia kujensis TaxID=1128675 RepID=UPI001E5457FB|nr:DNA ligase D [Pseudonocardia kujensis]MCE0762888.1 DNA ligase D [Pseudonocardia kujensis]